MCTLLGILAVVACDVVWLNPASSHSWRTLSAQYWALRSGHARGLWHSIRLFLATAHPRRTQLAVLMRVLRAASRTPHGRRLNVDNIHDLHEYIRTVPLSNYDEDYRKDFENIIESGQVETYYKDNPVMFATTSGTTGKVKYIPFLKDSSIALSATARLQMTFDLRATCSSLQRVICCRVSQPLRQVSPRIVVGSGSSASAIYRPYYVSPLSVWNMKDLQKAMHVHTLLALAERELFALDLLSLHLCHSFFNQIMKNQDLFIWELKHGRLSNSIEVDDEIRMEVNRSLHADPERADEVKIAIEAGVRGLARRLWPGLTHLPLLAAGSGVEHYVQCLQESFLDGVDFGAHPHVSSEGPIGYARPVNNRPQRNRFLPTLMHVFFEFIPEHEIGCVNPSCLLLDELSIGERYEVVITTSGGLFRYRLGDVIRVVDYEGACPVYSLVYRAGQMLSVSMEKTSEEVFYNAVARCREEWLEEGVILHDYTATESVILHNLFGNLNELHLDSYTTFVEILDHNGGGDDVILTQAQKDVLDSCLRDKSEVYNSLRRKGAISPLQVIQVERGTFDGLKAHAMSGGSGRQFKMPRVVRKRELLQWLMDHSLTS